MNPSLRVRTDRWQRAMLVVALLTLCMTRPVQATPLRQNNTACWISFYNAEVYATANALGNFEGNSDEDHATDQVQYDQDDNIRGLSRSYGASASAAASGVEEGGSGSGQAYAHVWTNIDAALSDGILVINLSVQPTSSANAEQSRGGVGGATGTAGGSSSIGVGNGIGVPVIVQTGLDPTGNLITGNNMNVGFLDSTNTAALWNESSREHYRHGMYSAKGWFPCVPPAFRVQFAGNQAAAASVNADTSVATWTMSRDSAATSFNLWRAGVIDGPYTQVNPAPIQAEAAIGDYKEYTHTLSAEAGLSFYKLEVVESDGSSTFYGPTAPIYPSLEQPVQVDLAAFTATHQPTNTVHLAWQTSLGIGSVAYALHQATVADGPYTRIDDSLTASGVVPTLPTSYSYTHTLTTPPSNPLYYKLEVIDILGNSTFHGPIEPQAEGTNMPPTAHAGWSYIGKEGSPLALNGTASADADGDLLTYDWNFGDGTTLANGGASPSHTYRDNGAYQVCLTTTDPAGASATDCITATITNLAPSAALINVDPPLPITGSPVTFVASFNDPGAGDSHSATVEWGDGTSSAATVDAAAGFVIGSHSYAAPGVYTLILSVSDDDQGKTTVTTTVTVMPASAGSGHAVYLPSVVR